jgi:DNA adenine methylase
LSKAPDININNPKPFIKWVGGKRQLIKQIKKYMPQKFNNYFEPFIGGGALFFDLKIENSFINDYNPELTNLYNIIKTKPSELIDELKGHINSSEYYYDMRALDRDESSYKKLSDVKKASRFIYLNKSGFNGLYRVNKKGQNNVPYGRYSDPKYLDEINIKACSCLLQSTTITTGDFENIKEHIKKGDFIYLDPPYVPLNATSSFTSYTDKGFDEDMQFRLKELCDYIDGVGAYFMLSNSYTDFILELYKDYDIKTVEANRALNCKASGRGKVNEVLVINY